MPARIDVAPAGAAHSPTHVVLTISRDALRQVMAGPGAAGQVGFVDEEPPDGSSDRLRHGVAAVALALAILSVPFLVGGRRRRAAAAAGVLAVLAGVTLVRADIAAPRPRPNKNVVPVPSPPGGPQTVEVVIVGGKSPVHVQLTYASRP